MTIYVISITPDTELTSLVIDNGGTGFTLETTTITIDPPPTGGTTAAASVTTVSGGVITAVSLDDPGSGYTTPPNVLVTSPTGTGAALSVSVQINFTPNTNILTAPITFASDEFNPGGGAIIRVWFCFETAADADTIISVDCTGSGKLCQFNADNNFAIKSKGLYRFDIPARTSDVINIESSVAISAINLLRFEKVVMA